MKRMAKPEGRGNVMLEDAPIPEPGYGEVRVKAVRSLISRGSEIGRRYVMEEAVDPQIMGYSMAGVVDALGEDVEHLAVGDRVGAVAPHAQYVVAAAIPERQAKLPEIFPLTPGVSWDQAPYWMLGASAVRWVDIAPFERDNVIVVLGQGLVGSLILQVMRSIDAGRLIAVDAAPLRCELAAALGADHVINAADEDPVAASPRLARRPPARQPCLTPLWSVQLAALRQVDLFRLRRLEGDYHEEALRRVVDLLLVETRASVDAST